MLLVLATCSLTLQTRRLELTWLRNENVNAQDRYFFVIAMCRKERSRLPITAVISDAAGKKKEKACCNNSSHSTIVTSTHFPSG